MNGVSNNNLSFHMQIAQALLNNSGSLGLQSSTNSSNSILELIKSNKNTVVSLRESYGSKNSIKAMAIDSIKSSLVALANSAYQLNNLSTETATREVQTTQEKTVSEVKNIAVDGTPISNGTTAPTSNEIERINVRNVTDGTYTISVDNANATLCRIQQHSGFNYDNATNSYTKLYELIKTEEPYATTHSFYIQTKNLSGNAKQLEIEFNRNNTIVELTDKINTVLSDANAGSAELKDGQIKITRADNVSSVTFQANTDSAESQALVEKLNFSNDSTHYSSLKTGTYTLNGQSITIDESDTLESIQGKLQNALSDFDLDIEIANNTLNVTTKTPGEFNDSIISSLYNMGFNSHYIKASNADTAFTITSPKNENVQFNHRHDNQLCFSTNNGVFYLTAKNDIASGTVFQFTVKDGKVTSQEVLQSDSGSTTSNAVKNIAIDGNLTKGDYSITFQDRPAQAFSLSLSAQGLQANKKISDIIENIDRSTTFSFNIEIQGTNPSTQTIEFNADTTIGELTDKIHTALFSVGAGSAELKDGNIGITTSANVSSISFKATEGSKESQALVEKLKFFDNQTHYSSFNTGTYTLGGQSITIDKNTTLGNIASQLAYILNPDYTNVYQHYNLSNHTLDISLTTTGQSQLDQDENLLSTLQAMGFNIDNYTKGQDAGTDYIITSPENENIKFDTTHGGFLYFTGKNGVFKIQTDGTIPSGTTLTFTVADKTILEEVTIQEEYEIYTDNSSDSIQKFIDQYNKTQALIKSTTKSGGALQYKQVIKKLNEELNDQINNLVNNDIGISKNKDGSLSLDTEKLKSVDVANAKTKFTQTASNLESSVINILDSNSKFSKEEARIDNIILKNDNALNKLKTNIQNSISSAESNLKNLNSILSTLNSQQTESVSILQEYLDKSNKTSKNNKEESDVNTLLETLGYSINEDS